MSPWIFKRKINVLGVFLKFTHKGWRIMKTCKCCCFISDKPLWIVYLNELRIENSPSQVPMIFYCPWSLSVFKWDFFPLPVYHPSSTTAQFWVSQRFEQTPNPKYQSWALSPWVLILLFLSFLKTAVKIIKLRLKRSVDAGPVSSCPYYYVAFKEHFDLKY